MNVMPCPVCNTFPHVGFPKSGGTVIACEKCLDVPERETMVSARVDAKPDECQLGRAARENRIAVSMWNGMARKEAA